MQNIATSKRNFPSYREALAWACLATILFTYIPYFRHIYWLFSGSPRPGTAYPYGSLAMICWTIVEQTILLSIATSLIMLWRKPENRDERDAAIEARAYRYALPELHRFDFHRVLRGGDHPGQVIGSTQPTGRGLVLASTPPTVVRGGRNYQVLHPGGRLQARLLTRHADDSKLYQASAFRKQRDDSTGFGRAERRHAADDHRHRKRKIFAVVGIGVQTRRRSKAATRKGVCL